MCAAFAVLLLALVSFARTAHAEAPSPRATPVHVLSIDSDDAEDQADALSGAIRSRVRLAPGWSLQETSHSLSMLTAALRCPQKPDTPCLQRIGDQIHTDRFIWGTMSKGPNNQVVADLLRKTGVADPYSAFVTDRTGRVIARFPHPDHEAGEPFRELAGPAGAVLAAGLVAEAAADWYPAPALPGFTAATPRLLTLVFRA